jgi:segregation and condensation protein A
MAISLAQNAIALLIELAERGELDPWDVQVIEVIDRFLSQIQPLQTPSEGVAPYEADLSQSGQAFLYASMLVLLKADSLARAEVEVEEDLEGEELAEPDDDDRVLPLNLERRLRRRAVARPTQQRRVTLKELIAQLEMIATAMTESTPRPKTRRPRPQSARQAVRAIAQLAHQENLSEVAAALEQFLNARWEELSQSAEWMEFEDLLERWVGSEEDLSTRVDNPHHTPQSDRVGVFWALLFLSAQSKVELSQAEFYQDLRVRSLTNLSQEEMDALSSLALAD